MKPLIPGRSLLAATLLLAGALSTATFGADNRTGSPRPKLVILVAEKSYDTPTSLAEFAPKYLARDFRVVTVTGSMEPGENGFDRIEEVADADVLFVSVVRRAPPKAQLDVIRRYVAAGKPVVGIRTANHAFVLSPGQPVPAGADQWPEWDAEVIGGNYHRHYGGKMIGTITVVQPAHAILRGVTLPATFPQGVYQVSPLRAGTQVLATGVVGDQPAEPIAWTFTRKGGGRTFYTSLGMAVNFKDPGFNEFLRNGVLWAAGLLR